MAKARTLQGELIAEVRMDSYKVELAYGSTRLVTLKDTEAAIRRVFAKRAAKRRGRK